MTLPDSVALLGVKGGPAIRPGSAMPTATLVSLGGRRVVVDCGLGVAAALTRQRMALADLDLILITHLHSDHVLELGPLIHTAWTAGLRTPVRVHGPQGLEALWQGFLASLAFDVDLRIADEGRPDLRDLVSIRPVSEGVFLEEGGLTVSALPVVHPPIEEAWAFRLQAEGRSVVLSGDTAIHPPLAAFARGADLLVHEAMLGAGVDALCARVGNADERLRAHLLRSHSMAEDVARLATEARVGALALNHLIPADDPAFTEADWRAAVGPHWSGPLHVGRDGMVIPFDA
ncbi:MAG: MBL fold metallo-hydrolase [Paracoccaceae bacterium]